MRGRRGWLALWWGLGCASAWAQTAADTLTPVVGVDSLVYVRGQNTRLGITTFLFENQVGGRMALSDRHHLQYDLGQRWMYNKLLRERPFVVRDLLADVTHTYRLTEALHWVQQAHLADYAAIDTRLLSVHTGLRWQAAFLPRHTVAVAGRVGVVSDRRRVATDNGLSLGATAHYTLTDTARQLATYVRGDYLINDISPRLNHLGGIELGVEKQFNQYALLNVQAGFRGQRVEDYLLPNVQSIRSDTAYARLYLSYALSPRLSFQSSNQWQTPHRAFYYRPYLADAVDAPAQNVSYQQGELDLTQRLRWVSRRWSATGSFQFQQRTRDYSLDNNRNLDPTELRRELTREKIKDIREETTTWRYELRYRPGRRHQLYGQTVARLLRVITPSPVNTQDRDELLYAAEAGWITTWNPAFRTTIKMSGDYKHFVFVTAAQSIENYQQRTLRFDPQFRWQTGRLAWSGQYQLSAGYQVRDAPGEQQKNRSNRMFIAAHQVNYQLDDRHGLVLDFLRRETRLGRLNWQTFQESPLDTTLVHDVTLTGRRRFRHQSHVVTGELGYRTFHQSRRQRAGLNDDRGGNRLIYLRQQTVQHGPVVKLAWQGSARLQISADGWFQMIHIFNRYQPGEGTFLGFSFTPAELALVQRNFMPYFNVNFYWRLARS